MGLSYNPQGPPDDNPFLLTMSQVLRVPPPPGTVPPFGVQVFERKNLGVSVTMDILGCQLDHIWN